MRISCKFRLNQSLFFVFLCLTAISDLAFSAPPKKQLEIDNTGEAAVAQPKVMFELRDDNNGKPLKRKRDDLGLEEIMGIPEPLAFLDTGASSIIISKVTADKFNLKREAGAKFIETGMAGEHSMNVSVKYTLALASHPRSINKKGEIRGIRGIRGREPAKNELEIFESWRFLINDKTNELTDLMGVLGNAVDVIGMPAIEKMVVEIQPQLAEETSVPVYLIRGRAIPKADIWLLLEMVNYSNKSHPENSGPLPPLSANPLVTNIEITKGNNQTTGDWLFDTGSAVTIISTKAAKQLDLLDENNQQIRKPDFELPMGGISGSQKNMPGYKVDQIKLTGEKEQTITFNNPSVLIHDITVTMEDGSTVTLDGILGMNLLLKSGEGFNLMGFNKTIPSAFKSIIIDGKRSRLGFTTVEN